MQSLVDDRPVLAGPETDFERIERAIAYLRLRQKMQPSLAQLAEHIGLSESHTQRLFTRWAGISPKRFLQYLTVEYAKQAMRDTGDLLGLALDAGLSGPGRLHDLFVGMEAVSPGEFRRAARGVAIRYGIGETPFGPARVAMTARGICHLSFILPDVDHSLWLQQQRKALPGADLVEDNAQAAAVLGRVFGRDPGRARGGLSLWLSGTNFQIQVWRALLQVPSGGLLSYRQLATLVGRPRAARAVGTAMACNPVAFLIPCHRVLRESGDIGIYHWGSERKAAMCAWEAAAGGPGVLRDPSADR
ncbi:MAG: methylated-DNA--[protein]-cysteine S-methyltransferase [Gammaproteobacteria bacterium]|nr:methylated-DNA--[protein]-cysteine S-methyltransferase [Gammaproteobacteria bacterium]